MSFAKHNLGVEVWDAPEYPTSIPPSTQVTVPFPVDNHPGWTTYPYAGVDIPDTFDNLITTHLPNALIEPVFYAAAIDTIRMTNRYFELVGQYRTTGRPLTARLVRQKEREWRNEKTKDRSGNDTALYPPSTYPRPPDLRTLFVKEDMGDPTNDKLKSLWTRACRDFQSMTPPTFDRYLRSTREELIAKAKARLEEDESWLILELFKRYLVWRNFVMQQTDDQQPTRAQMEAFFARPEVVANGATLVEICHVFPYARDTQMLVYRIERFATLKSQPSVITKAGAVDPVESRYVRNRVPSEQEIRTTAGQHLAAIQSSVSFPELLTQYWPTTGNHQIIADVLVTVARPDVTTGRFILLSNDGPDPVEIASVLRKDNLDGLTVRDIAELLPNRVTSFDELANTIQDSNFAYFDQTERSYFPMYESESSDYEGRMRDSVLHRNKLRLAKTWNAETIEDEYRWDAPTQRYVKWAERPQFGDVNAAFYIPQSPTYSPQSPTDVNNLLQSPTEADSLRSRTSPLEPQRPQITLQSGVVTAVQTTPVAPRVASPVVAPAAPPATSVTEAVPAPDDATIPPGERAQTPEPRVQVPRSKKRAAEDRPEGFKGAKKARKTLGKIRCSRNTQKGTRCKRSKDRVDGEEDWDCGVHQR